MKLFEKRYEQNFHELLSRGVEDLQGKIKNKNTRVEEWLFFSEISSLGLLSQNTSEVSAATGYLGEIFSGIFTIQSAEKLRSYSET